MAILLHKGAITISGLGQFDYTTLDSEKILADESNNYWL